MVEDYKYKALYEARAQSLISLAANNNLSATNKIQELLGAKAVTPETLGRALADQDAQRVLNG